MTTFLLTWNPLGDSLTDDDYEELTSKFMDGDMPDDFGWSTGNRTHGVAPGDRFYFLRQRRERGIVASGRFLSPVTSNPRAAWPNGAEIEFDEMRLVDDRLPVEVLLREAKGFHWNNVYSSGQQLPDKVAKKVGRLWHDSPAPIPIDFDDRDATEGPNGTNIRTNYDRDPMARRECIRIYGYKCAVCGFDFESAYGKRGARFIHVHHLHDLSLSPKRRKVDPRKDLRPVCANCHAMLHTERPALAIDALKKEMRAAKRRRSR